jgi:hypothetical protein
VGEAAEAVLAARSAVALSRPFGLFHLAGGRAVIVCSSVGELSHYAISHYAISHYDISPRSLRRAGSPWPENG